jgi:hypothetical protein
MILSKVKTSAPKLRLHMKATPHSGHSSSRDKKFRETILYVAERSQGDQAFGATKLNKLLFYSDFLAFLNFGSAITGEEYFRLPKGPAPRRLLPIRGQLEENGDAKVESNSFYGFPQNRLIPLRKADLSVFEAREIDLMDKVIEMHKGKTAQEISEESHGFIGWSLAQNKETIPYGVALVFSRQTTDKEVAHARSLEAVAAGLVQNPDECPENCPVGA